MTDSDGWRYFVLQDHHEPPYGVIRQRGPEIERWSPRRQCWYVAMFHSDLLWNGESGKRSATAEEIAELMASRDLPDIDPATVEELNQFS